MDDRVRRLIAGTSHLTFVSTAALLVGCHDQLPPQAPPPAEMPAVTLPSGQLAANRVWVVLDTPGDRANVLMTVGTTDSTDADGNTTTSNVQKKLCTTPCVYDLRPGHHNLEFDSTTHVDTSIVVDVDLKESTVVRQTMPVVTSPARDGRGYVALASGLLAANSFAFFIVAVSASPPDDSSGLPPSNSEANHHFAMVSAVSGAASAVGWIAFFVMVGVNRGTYSEGATTVFPLPKQTAMTTSPNGFGLRF